jgi:hypothetical protein
VSKKAQPLAGPAGLTVRIQDQDWVLIEGTPQALTELATQILLVATKRSDHVTLDHPGPGLTAESEFGLYVWRKTEGS